MSAFIVSTEHIDALVAAALTTPPNYSGYRFTWWWEGEHRELTHSNADQVGSMLLSENVRSVEFRYSPPGREAIYGEGWESDTLFELPGTYREETIAPGVAPVEVPEWLTPYTFPVGRAKVRPPVDVLKLISCFEYQSCEHAEWEESEAFAFCKSLQSKMIGLLPGYDQAKWSL
jgi:hypothetical protein